MLEEKEGQAFRLSDFAFGVQRITSSETTGMRRESQLRSEKPSAGLQADTGLL